MSPTGPAAAQGLGPVGKACAAMPARLRACGIVADTMSATTDGPLNLTRTGWASVRVPDENAEAFLHCSISF